MSKIISLLEGQVGKISYQATFRNEPIPDGVVVDKDNSVLKDAISLGECKPNEDGVTGELPFVAKAKAKSDLQIVFARKGVEGNVEGKDVSTQDVTIDVSPAELTLVTATPSKVKHVADNTYQINMSIKNGDQPVSLKDPSLTNASPDTFTIVGSDDKSFTIKMDESKVNKDPAIFASIFNFSLKLYSSNITHPLNVCWEPVVQATKLVSKMAFGEKGTMPIKITNGKGEDITSSITNLVCTSEYLKFDDKGNWEVVKEIANNMTHEVVFKFDVTQEGLTWPMVLKVTFDLLAKPKSISVSRLSESGVATFTSGTVKFKLTYDTGELVTDAVGVSYTNDSSRSSFSTFGSNFKPSNAANGEYTVDFVSGYVSGNSRGTVTIKTKYGEYLINLPSIYCPDEAVVFTPDTTLLVKGATNSKFTISAKQRQSMSGGAVPIYGTLTVAWLRGADVKSGPTGNGPWTLYLGDDGIGNTVSINLSIGNLTGSMMLYKA